MFNIRDKVVDIYDLDEVGIVRARYRHYYIVSWQKKGRRSRSIYGERENYLLAVDSPLIARLKEIDREEKELDKQGEILRKEREQILKGGGMKKK